MWLVRLVFRIDEKTLQTLIENGGGKLKGQSIKSLIN